MAPSKPQMTPETTERDEKKAFSQSSSYTSQAGLPDRSPSITSLGTSNPVSSTNGTFITPFVPPDNGFLGLVSATDCPSAEYHADGYLCHECRAIRMGWGFRLPEIKDDRENLITVGPEGTILEGVHLHEDECVAVLSVVVYLNVKGLLYTMVPGFADLMKKHPAAVKAGELMGSIYQAIERNALLFPRAEEIAFDYMVEQMLMHPEWRPDMAIGGIVDQLLRNRDFTEDGRAEVFPPFRDDPDVHGNVRPPRTHNEAHRPVPSADWVFSEGMDTARAEVGKPEPHKWFMVREDRNDPRIVDVREYPEIRGFDWDDKNDINFLNKYRNQISNRTGKHEATRRPWTLKEKDIMKDIIQSDIGAEKKGNTIDWNSVTKRMDEQFEGAVQEIGEPLAQSSKCVKGKWGVPYVKHPVLTRQLVGPAHRTAGACKMQAAKHHDIAAILGIAPRGADHARIQPAADGQTSTKPSTANKRKKSETGVKEQAEIDNGIDEVGEIKEITATEYELGKEDGQASKRRRKGQSSADNVPSKSFGQPPPPPLSAGSLPAYI